MTSDPRKQQRREWVHLYDRIRKVLKQFGEEDDGTKRKDYFLLDENLGLWQHRIETSNLEMVRPVVVKSLQKLLQGYSNWEISIAVTSPEADDAWPTMGLVISEDEIVDGLQRQYFPEQFRSVRGQPTARVAFPRYHLFGAEALLAVEPAPMRALLT